MMSCWEEKFCLSKTTLIYYIYTMWKTFITWLIMWACDVVPGVSGGTIAFISGIYDRLLHSLWSIADMKTLQQLSKFDIQAIRKRCDCTFLLTLFGGVGVSIFLFASLLEWLLEHSPHLVRGFFAGLVVASIVYLIRKQPLWTIKTISSLIIWAVVAYGLVSLSPTQVEPTRWMIIISAMIAISAMILPGISGSFLLLIMGMYLHVLDAVDQRDLMFLGLFMFWAVLWLLSIVRVVKYALDTHYAVTVSVLIWFLLWALPKLRPWQMPSETVEREDGEVRVTQTVNVSPDTYDQDAQFWLVLILFVIGVWWSLWLMHVANKD